MAQLQFDARNVAPDPGRGDPVPANWYNVVMEKSEKKPTKAGDGMYLETTYNIIDGQFAGRKLFHNFNIQNTNAQAQEIAYKQLSAVCHAIGVLTVNDSAEMHNRPLKVKVTVRPAEGQYEAQNEIKAFKNVNEQVGTPTTPVAGMGGMPAAAATAWAPSAPPAHTPAPQAWAQPPAMPPQQHPTMQQPPAAPPAWGQPPVQAQPPMQPQAPAWQAPPQGQPQPWAQPPQAPAMPPQAPPMPPQQWQPPAPPAQAPVAPAPVAQGAPVPPWMTQPPAQA